MAKLDFRAGLPPRKPGRKPRQTSNNISLDNYIYIDRDKLILVDDMEEVSSARDLKSELTLKELKFLEIYLTGGVSIDKAMISAGYGNYSEDGRYYIAKKIKEKYETRTGDHRKIFRAIGAGELAVARGLLEIAQTASSADVRRKAWADIASCLGLKNEQIESFQGVTLNVYSQEEAKRLGIQEKGAASGQSREPQHIQITK